MKTLTLLVALSAVLITTTAHAQFQIRALSQRDKESIEGMNTGVGNGGSGERDAHIQRIKSLIGPAISSSSRLEEQTAWCDNVASILQQEKVRSYLAFRDENLDLAIQLIYDALYAVASTMDLNETNPGPMTKQLVDRALLIATSLFENDKWKTSDRRTKVTFLEFFHEYFDFIEQTSRDFDRHWYIPFNSILGRCSAENCPATFRYGDLELHIVAIASQQLAFAQKLTEAEAPRVTTPLYLIVAQYVSQWAAKDLSETLNAPSTCYSIRALQVLSADLAGFNDRQLRTVYSSDVVAFQNSYRTIQTALSVLRRVNSCR